MKSVRLDANTIVSLPDYVDQQITVRGRVWRFHFDRRLGPEWLKANGEPRKCQNPNKAVWAAFEKWHKKQKEAAE